MREFYFLLLGVFIWKNGGKRRYHNLVFYYNSALSLAGALISFMSRVPNKSGDITDIILDQVTLRTAKKSVIYVRIRFLLYET
jgi:hypothetical protein